MKRIDYFDICKLFAAWLMILGHVVLYFCSPDFYGRMNNPLWNFTHEFNMPLFMTISGIFSVKMLNGHFDIIKKAKHLLVPCVTIAIVSFATNIRMDNLWYLRCLFLCNVAFALIVHYSTKCKINRKHYYILLASLFFLVSPILARIEYLYKFDWMFPFFVFGIIIGKKQIIESKENLVLGISFAAFLVLTYFWNSDFNWYRGIPNFYFCKTINDDLYNLYGCIYRYLAGASGAVFIITLFRKIDKYINNNGIYKNVCRLGRYSLHVYIIQSFVFLSNMCIMPNDDFYFNTYISAPIIAGIIVACCLILSLLLTKIQIIDKYLFGNF